MGKSIDTLVEDIYDVVENGTEVSDEDTNAFTRDLAGIVSERLRGRREQTPYLRLSNLGVNCDRKLWYTIRHPHLGESLKADTLLKFLIGDVWEAVLLFLARAAGHKVEGEQDEVDLYGVKGHRDAIIDGTLIDVKSASSRSFQKFVEGLTPDSDSFGYLTQLGGYLDAGQDDPKITEKDRAGFLVGDKTLGKLHLDMHSKSDTDFKKLVEHKQSMLESDTLPARGYKDVEFQKGGNRKLGVECSYCPFKKTCWPNLRTFLYSNGPVHMTVVRKEPNVPEV